MTSPTAEQMTELRARDALDAIAMAFLTSNLPFSGSYSFQTKDAPETVRVLLAELASTLQAHARENERLRKELEIATNTATDALYWLRAAKCHEMAGDIERAWKKARAALSQTEDKT